MLFPNLNGYSIVVALCYDTDVFGYVQKPKINCGDIEKMPMQDGAEKDNYIYINCATKDCICERKLNYDDMVFPVQHYTYTRLEERKEPVMCLGRVRACHD